jgi:hypothetical protein
VHLAEAFDSGGKPRQPMRGMLRIIDATSFLNLDADACLCGLQDAIGAGNGLPAALNEFLGACGQYGGSGLQGRDGHAGLLKKMAGRRLEQKCFSATP